MEVFDRIKERLGSQNAIADLCDVSPQAVSKWRETGIPPKHCRTLEAATGIPASDMRADIFGPAPQAAA